MYMTAKDGLDVLRRCTKGLRHEANRWASVEVQRGRLLAGALAGAWRTWPSPWTPSTRALEEIAPLLLKSGTAGLAWRRISSSDLPSRNAALDLREAHRHDVLQAALREHQLVQSLKLLDSARIAPLLAKGWAVARLYPERGLRPYGDIDLYVRPGQYP